MQHDDGLRPGCDDDKESGRTGEEATLVYYGKSVAARQDREFRGGPDHLD